MSEKNSSTVSSSGPSSPATERRIAGSRQYPFKLAVVGGGPSGCSILVRAARIGMLPDLCQFTSSDQSATTLLSTTSATNSPSSSSKVNVRAAPLSPPKPESCPSPQSRSFAGVCVIDAGSMERVGGGRLQDYVINSNTWINKFATNVVEEKPENLPPESMKETPFQTLLSAPSTKQIEDFGNKTGPLRFVGHFLRDVGQRAVAAVQAYPSSSKFYVRTKVESLHRVVENGKFVCWKLVLVNATYSAANSNASGDSCHSPTNKQGSTADSAVSDADAAHVERQEIYAVHVALATGGHQTIPNFINPAYRQKTLLSDVACTMEGVEILKTKIHRYLRACANHGTAPSGRVVVIGGSHSAFSAAWVCLNLVNEDASHRLLPSNSSGNNGVPTAASLLTTGSPIALNAQNQIKFGPSGVCILHRSAIRVFYPTRADAEHDHYPETSIVVNRITGNINPFGGIRGDAKDLWRAIRSTKEGRVRLLQVKSIPLASPATSSSATATVSSAASSSSSSSSNAAAAANTSTSSASTTAALKQSIVDKMLDEAIAIVWAAGYSTNLMPIYDHDGTLIRVQCSKGQVEVDEHANLLLLDSHYGSRPLAGLQPSPSPALPSYSAATNASSTDFAGVPVGNLYGSGLGYGLKATLDNGEPDGASGRADGVAVYLKRGATLILANVLGNRVYGGLNIHSWEERNQMLKKQQHQHSALGLNMTQILASHATEANAHATATVATTAKSPGVSCAPSSRRASFASPARNAAAVAAVQSSTPSSRVISTAIGMRTPTRASASATAAASATGATTTTTTAAVNGGSASATRRPASAGRVRVASSPAAVASTPSVAQEPQPTTKGTSSAVHTLSEETGGDALDQMRQQQQQQQQMQSATKSNDEKLALIRNVADHYQNNNSSSSSNQHTHQSVEVTSLSEPSTPATTKHPSKQQQQQQPPHSGSVKVLGSAGRAVVTGGNALVTAGAATAAGKAKHAPSPSTTAAMRAMRNSIDAKASAVSSAKQKVMPGPLPLHMGAANFALPPTSSSKDSASPTKLNVAAGSSGRSLLSSSLK